MRGPRSKRRGAPPYAAALRPSGLRPVHARVPPFDFETLLTDFETVMNAMAPEPVARLGISCGAPLAIAYATRHPDRVTALVLVNGYARACFSAPTTPPHLLEDAKLHHDA